ncbi:glycosyltransferase family 4 protein [Salirhabdus salicampi]|uniref:glycosyltransferase family 4 protein n=1 Tax=Salirhabdus salicampi TaxID=476102 RepID=UPI0020C24F04|nr:glycosyltransferase family 4 protein [Salirhabdus salicampi]MCP8617519.1 glycosyltransferase family 4 protein [Salirhabdus salicampi]
MKVFILGSYGPSLVNFRGDMIKAMVDNGHEVVACAPNDNGDIEDKVLKLGAKYLPIKMNRTGMNPLKDVALVWDIIRILRDEKPDVFLSYTIKPNIYGSLAAYFSGVENIYGLMTGAGSVIRGNTFKLRMIQKILIPLYKLAFKKCKVLFFLNDDDLELFKNKNIIDKQKSIIIGSSGINLNLFNKRPLRNSDTFLFIARLIRDKGIYEFLNAARIAKENRPKMQFKILGPFDSNPTAITPEELKKWTDEGTVEYLGKTDDVRPFIEDSFVVTLPSYHEGQGRVLVEAMAIGRAVIATDVSGCRQTVDDGQNGFLVPLKNSNMLAEKMITMYDNPEMTIKMAEKGYKRATDMFDVNKINNVILEHMELKELDKQYNIM